MSAIPEILACIDAYFEGLRTCTRAPYERAFHPDAHIVGPDEGVLKKMTREQFISFAITQAPDPHLVADILSIEVNGHIASVRVRDVFIGREFIDHLAMVEVDGEWCIFTKLWHVERKL